MNFNKLALVALMALGSGAAWATSVPAVTLTPNPSSTQSSGTTFSLGFEFSLSSTVSVDSLGFFSPNALSASHDVAIYDTGGTVLASATVLAADTLIGNFTYHSIAPVVLGPGTYIIMGQTNTVDPYTFNPTAISYMSGLTFIQSEYTVSSSLSFPTGTDTNIGYFGPNFTVTSTAPEPSSILLLSSSLLVGLGFARRKKK